MDAGVVAKGLPGEYQCVENETDRAENEEKNEAVAREDLRDETKHFDVRRWNGSKN